MTLDFPPARANSNKAYLKCAVLGPANVTWRRVRNNGVAEDILADQKYQFTRRVQFLKSHGSTLQEYIFTLVINKVQLRDAGFYECEVFNKHGSMSERSHLGVFCKLSAVTLVVNSVRAY